MDLKEFFKRIKHNHGLMMVLCCLVPLLLLYGAVYFFGLSKSYLYWFAILLCPLMHFWMMKDMHKHGKGQDEGQNKEHDKEGGGCH